VLTAAALVEGLDCLCAISTTAGKFCKNGQQGRRPATDYIPLTLIDCISWLPGIATGGTADLVLDAVTQLAQGYGNFGDGDPTLRDLLCACGNIL
jgi:hypothetical protein